MGCILIYAVEVEATGLRFDISDRHSTRRLCLRGAGRLLMRGEEMERIAALEPGIGTALDLEREFFQNRDQRLAYIVDMMEFWDEEDISGRREEAALAKGRAEGEAKGRAEGRAEAARNLLRMGLELSKISEATGLSLDEIETLK